MKREHYRDMIVRAVVGTDPAMTFVVADPAALDKFAAVLSQSATAKQTMCAKKYGEPNQSIDELVMLAPEAS